MVKDQLTKKLSWMRLKELANTEKYDPELNIDDILTLCKNVGLSDAVTLDIAIPIKIKNLSEAYNIDRFNQEDVFGQPDIRQYFKLGKVQSIKLKNINLPSKEKTLEDILYLM